MKLRILKKSFLALLCGIVLLIPCGGCEKTNIAQKKFWILCDLDSENLFWGNYRTTERASFLKTIEHVVGIKPENVEFEFLPTASESERSAQIAALRTEIMAGGGPDLYILSCHLPGWKNEIQRHSWYDVSMNYEKEERLFTDVQAAMKNKCFLPLDDLIQNDALWLDTSLLHTAALDAGRTEEGQVVLPLTMTFPLAFYQENALSLPLPDSFAEAKSWKDTAVRHAYATAANRQFPDILGQLADYETETLLFSEEKLLDTVRWAVKAQKDFPEQEYSLDAPCEDGFCDVLSLDYSDFWNWDAIAFPEEGKEQFFSPIRNLDNGVTASIVNYVCINRNTKYPKEAFRTAEILFTRNLQSTTYPTESWEFEDFFPSPVDNTQSFLLQATFGVPVRNDLLKNSDYSYIQHYVQGPGAEEIFQKYTEAREEITCVRFYGTLELELQEMYEKCLKAENKTEMEAIVSETYQVLLMILAES